MTGGTSVAVPAPAGATFGVDRQLQQTTGQRQHQQPKRQPQQQPPGGTRTTDSGDKNGEPTKHKVIRKASQCCGPPQPVQDAEKVRKRSSHDRESSTKGSAPAGEASNQQIVKVVPKRPPSTTTTSGISPHARTASRKHGQKQLNESSADIGGGRENSRVARKEGGKEKSRDKVKERDGAAGKKDRTAARKSGIASAAEVGTEKDAKHNRGPAKGSTSRSSSGRGSSKHRAPDPEESHAGGTTSRPDPEEIVLEEVETCGDGIPLTRSPNVPKYTVKVSREGCKQPPVAAPPFRKDGGGGGGDENELECSERATGVFMMAARAPSAHAKSSSRRARGESDEKKKEDHAKAVTSEDASSNESRKKESCEAKARTPPRRSLSSSGSSSGEGQLKKPPGGDKIGKLWQSHNHDSSKGTRKGSDGKEIGKPDFSHLWESHNSINRESLHINKSKSHGNGHKSSFWAKDDPAKKHRSSKAKESRGKPLRGSITNKDATKKTADKSSSMDQSKGSGSHNVNAPKPPVGKIRVKVDGSKKKDLHSGNANNHKPTSRGRPNQQEARVRFRRGRSHSPKRKKGIDNAQAHDKTNNDRTRKQQPQQQFQRSKSLPQKSQRKRVPTEYHVQHQARPGTTLNDYRQTFLEEMAQMSIMKSITVPAATAEKAEKMEPAGGGALPSKIQYKHA